MKKNRRVMKIILLIAGSVTVILLTLVYQTLPFNPFLAIKYSFVPQPTVSRVIPTVEWADWNSHTSDILGIRFKYPPGMEIKENPDEREISLAMIPEYNDNYDYERTFYAKFELVDPGNMQLREYAVSTCNGMPGYCAENVRKTLKFYRNGGKDGIQYSFMGDYLYTVFPAGSTSEFLVFSNFTEEGAGGPTEAAKRTAGQILYTLEFFR